MNKLRVCRLLSILLAVFMTVPMLFAAVGTAADEGDTLSDDPITVIAFDRKLDGSKFPHQILPGAVYGIRMHIGGDFNAFAFCLPTWGDPVAACTLVLYAWQSNYDETVEAVPLAERRIDHVRDCQTYKVDCGDLPAGEYYFAIRDVLGTVGTWAYPAAVSKGFIFDSSIESRGDLELTLFFNHTPVTPFLQVVSVFDVDGAHTAPEPYVLPNDSLIYTHEVMPDTWVFTDGLGRRALTNADVGDPRDDRTLAMFYWTWHGDLGTGQPFNINEFMKQYPEARNDYYHPAWPTSDVCYFWNEPVYGYYRTFDEWVLRKQGELLANAGVDVIFTDNTNGAFTWRTSYTKLYKAWDEAQKDGTNVPKISFLLPFAPTDGNKEQISNIYMDIYRPGKYQNLWYYFDGKPMLMGFNSNFNRSDPLGKEVLRFFTFRPGQPAYNVDRTGYKTWGWLSAFPQALYYKDKVAAKEGDVEQMTVGVSVNYRWTDGACTAMNGTDITGRSYTTSGYHTEPDASLWGYHFAEQFDYALEKDPRVLFVTGWNEWTAGRQEVWGGVENGFADEFDNEYSRDIEPSRGELRDHYYYQLVNYVRRYKGARPIPTPTLAKTVDITASPDQWNEVGPYYAAYIGNTGDRDSQGYGSLTYSDHSGRNDIIGARVARDDDNIYFLCECQSDITPYTDALWMNLYIDCDQEKQGWESFDFVINKTAPTATHAVLEKFTGDGYTSEKVADVVYTVNGRYLQISVPKSALGLSGYDFTVNFSWTDNVHDVADTGTQSGDRIVYTTFTGDILDFYTSGDVAPGGRFQYSYVSTRDNAMGTTDETETQPETDAEPQSQSMTEAPTAEPAPDTRSDTETQPTVNTRGCTSLLCLATLFPVSLAALLLRKRETHA